MMDLHEIANTGSYGTGRKAREAHAALTGMREALPYPAQMAELYPTSGEGGMPKLLPCATLGHCSDTDRDWFLEHDSEAGLIIGLHSCPSEEAKALAAIWNAYRLGKLVWNDTSPT